jgi:hypothetical protein
MHLSLVQLTALEVRRRSQTLAEQQRKATERKELLEKTKQDETVVKASVLITDVMTKYYSKTQLWSLCFSCLSDVQVLSPMLNAGLLSLWLKL